MCVHILLNGATQIKETALPFPQFALLHSVACVQLRLTTILGNCGCVTVASFLGDPSPLLSALYAFVHLSEFQGAPCTMKTDN
jgi:xanthine dehydrogenase iron-sulfur cluster and FAD-binding subunit A